MINFARHTLSNGLRVVVHREPLAPIATFNILYSVGARNESPERTGFAHLFEHLMFGGSVNVQDFDTQVQRVGGDSNAFTTNDLTNFFITLPVDNLETAFWLESDRMLQPAFSQEGLDVQKKVVVEEFRQRYLNRPYGDFFHLLRGLSYKVHPYRWPTIGIEPQHILDATLDDVRNFFYQHYIPRRAIITVSGNVDPERVFALAEKWFGEIRRDAPDVQPPVEPEQTEARRLVHHADVPADRVAIAFHTCGRLHPEFPLSDLTTDILSDGESSRLIQRLVHDTHLCTDANAYVLGSVDPGLMIFTATAADGVDIDSVEKALWSEIESLASAGPSEHEVDKSRNRLEASAVMAETSAQYIAQSLARCEMYGDANMINTDVRAYDGIAPADIAGYVARTCVRENSSTLLYLRNKQ